MRDELKDSYAIGDILSTENLCDLLSDEDLEIIGRAAVKEFELDDASRDEWKSKYENSHKLALQVYEAKTNPWPGASSVKFPLITIASLQFNSRAYPALVTEPELVKCRVIGEDPNGQKELRADRVGPFMSWQLMEEDENWSEDTDKLTMALPIVGFIIRKSYYDPIPGHIKSEMVLPQDFVVSYYTKSLEQCPRATQILHYSLREIRNRQRAGYWREVEIGRPAPTMEENLTDRFKIQQGLQPPQDDPEEPREILEQHRYFDLDGDGYEEPYVVTVDKDSHEVLRMFARYSSGDIRYQHDDKIRRIAMQGMQILEQPLPQDPQKADIEKSIRMSQTQSMRDMARDLQDDNDRIIHIEPINYFTKYSFIPAPDGSFYDLGFGSLLGPVNHAVDTLINQLIDAGTLQVSNVGFLGSGIRVRGGDYRFRPFEWKKTDVPGGNIKDSILPLPVNAPSGVLLELLQLLITYGERISSVSDQMMGELPGQNTPASTAAASLDQGMKVFGGIMKRLYRAFKDELRKRYKLNRMYLDPQQYFTILDTGDPATVFQMDFLGDPDDIVPEADPSIISDAQRQQRAMFLAGRSASVPGYNAQEVELRLLKDFHIPNPKAVYTGAPPPPNPEIVLKQQGEARKLLEAKSKIQNAGMKTMGELQKMRAQAVNLLADASKKLTEREIAMVRAEVEGYDMILNNVQNMMELEGALSAGTDGGGNQGLAAPGGNPMGGPPAAGAA